MATPLRSRDDSRDSFSSMDHDEDPFEPEARISMTSCGGCSVFGVRVRVHYLFIAFFMIGTMSGFAYGFNQGGLGLMLYGPVLLLTCVLHEMAHCLAAKWSGSTVDRVLLFPLGGVGYQGQSPALRVTVAIAMAGPVSHIPQGLFWWALAAASDKGHMPFTLDGTNFWQSLCFGGFFLQLFIGCVNLIIPAYPLDGARIIAAFLVRRGHAEGTVAKWMVFACLPLSLGMLVVGIYLWFTKSLAGALFVSVSLWTLYSSFRFYQFASNGTASLHPIFSDAMDRPVTGNVGNTV